MALPPPRSALIPIEPITHRFKHAGALSLSAFIPIEPITHRFKHAGALSFQCIASQSLSCDVAIISSSVMFQSSLVMFQSLTAGTGRARIGSWLAAWS